MGEALEQLILGAEEKLQESLGTLEKDIQRVQEGQDNLRKEVLGRLRELQNSVDHLAQSATWRQPEWRGVGRASATLRTLDDVLDLVLPDVVKSAPPELRDAIISTAVEQLLENDFGVLQAVAVLLEEGGMPEDAEAVRQLHARGLDNQQAVRVVSRRLVALMAMYRDELPQELGPDLGRLFQYIYAKPEERRELLAGGLFVRCAAAVLCRSEIGELEVEKGTAAWGCEFNGVTQVLQVNMGKLRLDDPAEEDQVKQQRTDFLTKSLCAAKDKAERQLIDVGKIATYTLDRALMVVHSAPGTLPQLPNRVFVHGVISYVGAGPHMQAEGQQKRVDLSEVLSGKERGLEGATLVLAVSARHS